MLRNLTWAALALGLAVLVGRPCPGVGPQEKGKQDKGQEEKGKTVTLKKEKDAKVKLAKGDKLVLRLKMQGGTGFSWTVGKNDKEKLKPLGKPKTEKPKKVLPGGAVTQVFRFEAVADGSVRLEMWYKRPFEKDKKPAKKFSVAVEIE